MDQLGAMRAFVRIAETGSFSAVARESNTTQATISKRVAALEEKLGVRLLARSSREQSLTEAGRIYYQHSVQILESVDEADTQVRCQTEAPRGLLRITVAVDFARKILSPLLQEFMARYPDIKLDLVLDNAQVDLVAMGIDVAIRADVFKDSSLIARPLCNNPLYLVAAPDYLKSFGTPKEPEDLKAHQCLLYSVQDNPHIWSFTHQGKTLKITVDGRFQCNNADLQLEMVLAGKGIAILPFWMIQEELERGELTLVLPEYKLPSSAMSMVYPDRKLLPLKTRCFLDFMAEKSKEHPGLK